MSETLSDEELNALAGFGAGWSSPREQRMATELLAARKKLAELEATQFQARVELHATVRKLNCDNADEFWAAIGRIRARAETAEARAEAAEATVERLRAALEAYEHFPEARAALQESTDG